MKRILDRHNYSNKTIEVYEIMSAYYVDIFYNHLYIEAKKLKASGNVSSITEGYKHTLNAFLKGLSNPKLYKKSIVGIHYYFINIGFASISFSKCVDNLTKAFIPSDYFNSLSSTQKMGVLRMVINQSMKIFIKSIVDEHMSKIIDNHKDSDNVRILQDVLIDCFILEREGMYQRFISQQTTTHQDETVNRLVAEKMQQEIKKLVKEKYEQKRQISILTKAYTIKKNAELNQATIIKQLNDKIQLLTNNSMVRNMYGGREPNENTDIENKLSDRYVKRDNFQVSARSVSFDELTPEKKIFSGNLEVLNETPKKSNGKSNGVKNDNSDTDKDDDAQTSKPRSNKSLEIESDSDDDSNFIEINTGNIGEILNADTDYLEQMRDSSMFNTTMDEGTTLDDFS